MLRNRLPATFNEQINKEISALDLREERNKTISNNLKKIANVSSLDELLISLKNLGPHGYVTTAASSSTIQAIILEHAEEFIQSLTRNNMKALIYQVCISGNFILARHLIDKIKLDVTKEKVGNPFGCATVNSDSTIYQFDDTIMMANVAAKSKSLEFMRYIVSQYDLSKLDKTSVTGDLQSALATAAENNDYDIVEYLLNCGVNVNSKSSDGHNCTAVYYAVIYGSLKLVELLVERGATIDYLNKSHAVRYGKIDIVKYMVSKGESFEGGSFNSYLEEAFESQSVDMVKYFIDTLKFKLYSSEDEEHKQYINKKMVNKAARAGSIALLKYMEDELQIPVTEMIRDEIAETKLYNHNRGNFIMIDAVCSYNINLLKFLFDEKGLKPNDKRLEELLEYAYNNGSSASQHRKLITHAYIWSLVHKNAEIRPLLTKLSGSTNLSELNNDELFMLYTDYTINYPVKGRRFQYVKFRENSIYLAKEIMARNLTPEDMLNIAKKTNALAAAVQFFLIVSGECNSYRFMDLLKDSVFNPNHDYGIGQRPLHFALHFRQLSAVDALLEAGADPDLESDQHETPITFIDADDDKMLFDNLIVHAKTLTHSLYCSIKDEDSATLFALLKLLKGDVSTIDIIDWLKHGEKCPGNLFKVLCNLNAECFQKAKDAIPASNSPELIKALTAVEHFLATGKKPKDLRDYENQRIGEAMIHSFFGGACCGGSVMQALALEALRNGEIKIESADDDKEERAVKLT